MAMAGENFPEFDNPAFLTKLKEEIENEQCRFKRKQDNGCYTYDFPKTENGLHLLKVFGKIVLHKKFVENQSFEIVFPKKGSRDGEYKIEVLCKPYPQQPRNAYIQGYRKYEEFELSDFKKFAEYFATFLAKPLDPKDLHCENWELSVLLLFEIVRRLPEKDRYRDIPVAVAIQMAMKVPKLNPQDLFNVFRNPPEKENELKGRPYKDRREAYKLIRDDYLLYLQRRHLTEIANVFLKDDDDVDEISETLENLGKAKKKHKDEKN